MATEYVELSDRERYLAACYLMGAIIGSNATSREGAPALALDLLDALEKEMARREDEDDAGVRTAMAQRVDREVKKQEPWPFNQPGPGGSAAHPPQAPAPLPSKPQGNP